MRQEWAVSQAGEQGGVNPGWPWLRYPASCPSALLRTCGDELGLAHPLQRLREEPALMDIAHVIYFHLGREALSLPGDW